MPFPLAVTDGFNRANGAPGGLWTPDPDASATNPEFTISSNQLVGVGANAWMFYDRPLGALAEASILIGAYSAGTIELELIINAGTADFGGYAISTDGTDTFLYRYGIPSGFSTLDTVLAGSFSAGDSMGLRVLGDGVVEGWGEAGGGWVKVLEAVDPDPIVGNFVGAPYMSATSSAIDDFSVLSLADGGGMLNLFRRRRIKE